MYYLWRSEIRKWDDRIVELNLNWGEDFPPRTIVCKALRDRLPSLLEYELVPDEAPLLDCLWTANHYDLFSPAAVRYLSDFGAPYETVPAVIRGKYDQPIATDYSFAHILGCLSALDWDKSDVEIG